MKKDDFWSIDKLLPPIRLSSDFSLAKGSVSLNSLDFSLPEKNRNHAETKASTEIIRMISAFLISFKVNVPQNSYILVFIHKYCP